MRLLICTQNVDENDPLLGFFHGWIIELAKHFEHITVLALRSGEKSLPGNVEVVTLGGSFRFQKVFEICAIAIGRRKEYDAVFVHMSQEFVLAGGLIWGLLRKPVYLWHNHYVGSIFTHIAAALSKKVFCTSRYAYSARFKKTTVMPVGIDLALFKPVSGVERIPHSILFFGRLMPSKRPELLLEALSVLHKRGVEFSATLCGPGERAYMDHLQKKAQELGVANRVAFRGGISNQEAPRIYSSHEIFVNLSSSGMFDKTLFEAAACGCAVLAVSKDFSEQTKLPALAEDPVGIAETLQKELERGGDEISKRASHLKEIIEAQGITVLGKRLAQELRI